MCLKYRGKFTVLLIVFVTGELHGGVGPSVKSPITGAFPILAGRACLAGEKDTRGVSGQSWF